jgi:hypothetical protein
VKSKSEMASRRASRREQKKSNWPEFAPKEKTDLLGMRMRQEAAAKTKTIPSNEGVVSKPPETEWPVYKRHPLSACYRDLNEDEQAKQDQLILSHQRLKHREKVWLARDERDNNEWKIIDGWQYDQAGRRLGVQPIYERLNEVSYQRLKEWVIQRNEGRRNMSADDRAKTAAKFLALMPEGKGGNPELQHGHKGVGINPSANAEGLGSKQKERERLADEMGVSVDAIQDAEKLLRHAPEVFQSDAPVRKAAESIKVAVSPIKSAEYEKMMAQINEACGEEFYHAVGNNQIPYLQTLHQVDKFCCQPPEVMRQQMPGFVAGLRLEEIERWTNEAFTPFHSLLALFWHVLTLGQATRAEFDFDGWKVTIESPEELREPLPEPPPLFKPKKKPQAAIPKPTREQCVEFMRKKKCFDCTEAAWDEASGLLWDRFEANWCDEENKPILNWFVTFPSKAQNGYGPFWKLRFPNAKNGYGNGHSKAAPRFKGASPPGPEYGTPEYERRKQAAWDEVMKSVKEREQR